MLTITNREAVVSFGGIHVFVTPHWVYRAGTVLIQNMPAIFGGNLIQLYSNALLVLELSSWRWPSSAALSASLVDLMQHMKTKYRPDWSDKLQQGDVRILPPASCDGMRIPYFLSHGPNEIFRCPLRPLRKIYEKPNLRVREMSTSSIAVPEKCLQLQIPDARGLLPLSFDGVSTLLARSVQAVLYELRE